MAILVIAEHNNHTLSHATLPTLQAAMQFNEPIEVLVLGYECTSVAEEAASYRGVTEVIQIDHLVYQHQLAENCALVIVDLANDYSHVLAPASTFGKNLMPRIAGLMKIAQVSDVIEIVDDKTFRRPIYAGNAIATVRSLDVIKLLTIRSTSFAPAATSSLAAPIRCYDIVVENKLSQFVQRSQAQTDCPDLTAAKIVISGGRGLQSADNFKLLEEIAKQLGAAIGASRAAVDAGFVSNDYQIGQTGKVVAPDLYIAVGISGAIQHIAGIKDSKVIVAINKDPDAPIFAVADYGLVGDLFKVLPEFQQELIKLGYK